MLLQVTEEVLGAVVSAHHLEVVLEEEATVHLQEVVVSARLHAEVLVEDFHRQVEVDQAAIVEVLVLEEVGFKGRLI